MVIGKELSAGLGADVERVLQQNTLQYKCVRLALPGIAGRIKVIPYRF